MLVSELPCNDLDSDAGATLQGALQSSERLLASHNLDKFVHSFGVCQGEMKASGKIKYICKHCKKEFSSGRALGGHMRAHGSLSLPSEATTVAWKTRFESMSSSGRQGSFIPYAEELNGSNSSGFAEESPVSSLCIPREKYAPASRKVAAKALSSQEEGEFEESSDIEPHPKEHDEETSVKGSGSSLMNYSDLEVEEFGGLLNNHAFCDTEFPNGQELNALNKAHQLYTLRRNPKPSKRFEDQEYAMEMVASAAARKAGSVEKDYVCTECGKDFVSSKALFGHMRCHPERDWRGIQRPKTDYFSTDSDMKKQNSSSSGQWQNSMEFNSDNESDAESIEAAYLNRGFKSSFQMWMTGKRSKRSRHSFNASQPPSDRKYKGGLTNTLPGLKEERDMADCLLLLSYAGEIQEELESTNTRVAVGYFKDWERKKHAKASGETESYGFSDDRNRSIPYMDDDEISQSEDSDEASEDQDTVDGDAEVSDQATDGGADGKLRYECTSCKRIFKSHQALGGHRASHKKVKGCFAKAHASEWESSSHEDVVSEYPSTGQVGSYGADPHLEASYADSDDNAKAKHKKRPKLNVVKKTKLHQCSICHRIFPTGQALGGHKRCHWGGGGSSETNNPQLSSQKHQVENFQKSDHTKEELLDLNLLPAPEQEADEFALDFRVPSTFRDSIVPDYSLRLISSAHGAHQMLKL